MKIYIIVDTNTLSILSGHKTEAAAKEALEILRNKTKAMNIVGVNYQLRVIEVQ